MKKNGYTVLELIIVIAVMGIITAIALVKTSYAFDNKTSVNDEVYYLIEKQAKLYGENNLDKFSYSNEMFILVKDLEEAKYVPLDENGNITYEEFDMSNLKIKLTKNSENIVTAKIIK